MSLSIPEHLVSHAHISGRLKLTAFVLLAPLSIYAELQILGLLPAWPLFPPPGSLLPFSLLSPLQLPHMPENPTLSSCARFVASVAVSPVFISWETARAKSPVRTKIYRYLRAALPKPQIPDRYSIEGASEDAFENDNVPGLCNAIENEDEEKESSSFGDELAKDLQFIGRTYQNLYDKLLGTWNVPDKAGNSDVPHGGMLIDHQELDRYLLDRQQEQPLNIDLRLSPGSRFYRQSYRPPGTDPLIGDMLAAREELLAVRAQLRAAGVSPHSTQPSPSLGPSTTIAFPRAPATPVPELNLNSPAPPFVPHSHTEPDVSDPSPAAFAPYLPNLNLDGALLSPDDAPPSPRGGPPSPENAENSRRSSVHSIPQISTNQFHTFHRLTMLSTYPANSLATHLSWHIVEFLFLPIETLYVRSIALSFLASPLASVGAQAAASRWRGEIYPLGSWFGMGLNGEWRGIGDYVGKMVLLSGLEMALGMLIWQPCTLVCRWLGRRWFGWGKLVVGKEGAQVGEL